MSRSLAALLALLAAAAIVAPASLAPAPAEAESDALDELATGDDPVRLHFPSARLGIVFETLARVGGFEVAFEGDEPEDDVTIDWTDVTVKEALAMLRDEHGVRYRVPDAASLVVIYPAAAE